MKRTLTITAILLVLAAGITYLALRPEDQKSPGAAKKWTPEPLVPKETPIIRIGLKNPNGEVVLEWTQKINNWTVIKPRRSIADTIYIKPFIEAVGDLKKEKIIAIDPPDLSIYQLDQPRGEITVEFAENQRPPLQILLGKENYNQDAIYAKLAGEPTVFLVSDKLRQYLAASSINFRSSRLMLHEPPVIGTIEYEILDPKIKERFPELENYKLVKQQNTRLPSWYFVAPFNEMANVNKVTFFLARNTLNTTNNIIDIDDGNYSPYGFDHPCLRITLTDDKGSSEVIEFGKFDPEKQIFYARNLAIQEVMATTTDYYKFIVQPGLRYNRVLFPDQGNNITRLEIKHPADPAKDFTLVQEKGIFFHFENQPERKSSRTLVSSLLAPFSNRELNFVKNLPPYDRAPYGLEKPRLHITAFEEETPSLDVTCGNTVNYQGMTYTYIEDLNRHYIAALPVNVYYDLPVTAEHLTMTDEQLQRILKFRERRKERKQRNE